MSRGYLVLFCCAVAAAQDARQIVAESLKRTRSQSQRYEGVLQVIDARGGTTEKRWRYDRIGAAGESKTILRFTAPAEVKDVAVLVVNHPDRPSEQWMWTPAIQRERRIAVQDRSTRFFGTGFSFEDLEERDVEHYDYQLVGEETFEGALCWKIRSQPKKSRSSQYTHTFTWMRKENYTLVQVEAYAGEKIARKLNWREWERIQGIWTARRLEVFDARRNTRTIMKLEKLDYNETMKDEDFTLQALRRGS